MQTSGPLDFSTNEKYEQSAVPEEIRRAKQMSFLTRNRKKEREREKNLIRKGGGNINVPKVLSSHLLKSRQQPYLLLRFSVFLLSHLVSRHEALSAPKSSATCVYACMKNFRSKSSEASSLRSHVTNHLSRGARFRSTPKRGERWNCGCRKNASRCDDWEIIPSRWNLCRVIRYFLWTKAI